MPFLKVLPCKIVSIIFQNYFLKTIDFY